MLLFLDPESEIRNPGWVKIRIRDRHPGSAILVLMIQNVGGELLSLLLNKDKIVHRIGLNEKFSSNYDLIGWRAHSGGSAVWR